MVDGAVDIQFFCSALAGEFPQTAQRDLDIARAQFDLIVEVLVLALLPYLGRLALARSGIAHANAFGVIAARAERAGATGADPLVAPGMAFLLLLKALFERLDQLVQAAQGLELGTVLVA